MGSTYEASVERSFNAAHALRLPDGTWEDPHQHRWEVTAVFRSADLDETMGVVVDFVEVDEALKTITDELEGADLNKLDALADGRPSAERVAELVAGLLAERLAGGSLLYCVGVTEAPGCRAAFYPRGPRS